MAFFSANFNGNSNLIVNFEAMSKRIKKDSKLMDNRTTESILVDNRFLTHGKREFFFSKMHDFDLPGENETYHYLTNRKFSAIEIVNKILDDEKVICSQCSIIIYSINLKAGERFVELYKNRKIQNLTFLFSTLRFTGRNRELDDVYAKLERFGKFKIGYFSTHAKVIAMKTNAGNFTIEMSCNFSANSKIENVTITNHAGLVDFQIEAIDRIIDLKNDA